MSMTQQESLEHYRIENDNQRRHLRGLNDEIADLRAIIAEVRSRQPILLNWIERRLRAEKEAGE